MTEALEPGVHLTPLTEAHRALGARLIEFGGWLMPVQYGSIIEEHRAVRERVGLFDLSHMGELYVEGPDAGAALAYALVSDPPRLAIGRAHYSMICAANGGIVDDLIVYRLADARYLVVANAGNAAIVSDALAERLGKFKGVLDDRALSTGLLAVQGPRARDVLAPLTDVDLGALRYYAIAEGTVAGIPALVARTGYTGEDGFEVFVETGLTGKLWEVLLGAVEAHDGVPVGLGARDTLRLEAGMPLYGNELDLADQPVRGRSRPRGQARQDGRLRRTSRPREGCPRRAVAQAGRPGRRGPRHRPARLPGPVRRAPDRRRDQRHAVADAGHPDRHGLRRAGRRRAGYRCRHRSARGPRPRSSRRAAVLPEECLT